MKKINIIIAVFAMAFATTSCGASKQVAVAAPVTPVAQGTPELSEGQDVMDYAMADPDRRAMGDGSHFKEATAKRIAEANARAALAANIKSMIVQSIDQSAGDMGVIKSVDGMSSELTSDQYSTMNEAVAAISKESVVNTATVKMQRYFANNQYKIYVCVENRMAPEQLAEQISEKLETAIPQEIRDEIDFDKYKHQKKMEELFEGYTSATN
ncbi:MAG: hypothetical protein R3Y08_03800 [Rikenellaceae bacterium]